MRDVLPILSTNPKAVLALALAPVAALALRPILSTLVYLLAL